jgi:hypothetical protein
MPRGKVEFEGIARAQAAAGHLSAPRAAAALYTLIAYREVNHTTLAATFDVSARNS